MDKSTHTTDYAAVCAELRKARENAGLTQRELAIRLKVPHSWVAKVERGERRIDIVEMRWFLDACGVDPLDVVGRIVARGRAPQKSRRGLGGPSKS